MEILNFSVYRISYSTLLQEKIGLCKLLVKIYIIVFNRTQNFSMPKKKEFKYVCAIRGMCVCVCDDYVWMYELIEMKGVQLIYCRIKIFQEWFVCG